MTHELQNVPMDIDTPGRSTQSPYGQNSVNLYPVSVNDSGEGLPYAPENFPNPGDKWGWKAGKRINASGGYFLDRYMYLPASLGRRPGHKRGFASRLSVLQYVRANFPDADVNAFLASFSWRIPCKKDDPSTVETAETPQPDGVHCKAGNEFCSSLATQEDDSISQVAPCDLCCSEPSFCKDCCCILCCRTINNSCDGYSYIRCEAKIDGYDCGHICHIECALRAYMAGTVGGNIGLDAEYYCRRCDCKTDLVSHVRKLLENWESIGSRDEIEKILKVGIRVLRGSEKTSAVQMLRCIELAMSKLKSGTCIEDIWKEDVSVAIAGLSLNPNGGSGFQTYEDSPQDCKTMSPPKLSSNFDYRVESLKLEDEIDQVLNRLKKSQTTEYMLAEEKLLAQKNYILNLYQQLDKEKCDLSRHTSSNGRDSLLDDVLNRINQIKGEVSKLKDMEEVAKGFGRVPKHILKEQYGIDIEY